MAEQYTYNPVTINGQSVGNIKLTAEQQAKLKKANPTVATSFANDAKPLSQLRTQAQADILINQNQVDDIAAGNKANDAPTRDSALTSAYASFSQLVSPKGAAPTAPSFEASYNKLRDQYDVTDLETSLSDLEAQEEDAYARLRERTNTEMDKTVPLNVISGRVGEAERQEMERVDFIRRQKQTVVNQLNSANAAIQNVMTFKKMDYEVARDTYNDEFGRNLKMFDAVYGMSRDQKSDQEAAADNARANLQVIYGAIKDGGMDATSIGADQRYQITKLELEAGLPSGFFDRIAEAAPEGKILSTTTRTTSGAKYADVLYRQADGSLKATSVYLGRTNEGSSGESNSEAKEIKSFQSDASRYIEQLSKKEIGWGAAFNALKAKYPNASNNLIDATLNKDAYYTTEYDPYQ